MSVINRMLRDLDQRQKHPQSNAGPAAIAPLPRRKLLLVVWLVIAVILAGLVFYFSWQQTNEQPGQIAQQREPAELVNAEQLAPVAAEPQPQQRESSNPNGSSEALLAADSTSQSPDSGSVAAKNSASQPTADTTGQLATVPEPPASDPAGSAAARTTATMVPQTEPTTPSTTSVATPADTSEPSLSVRRVQLSPAQLAARNLEKAEEAFSKGQQQQGQELLEQALTVQPLNTVVRERLAAYWYGRGYGNRALAILQQGIQLQPQAADLKLLLARMYQRLEMPADALEVLKSMTLSAERSREGLSIRAELAWKAADYAQAVTDYQALTQAMPGNARWWLGLALALDDSGAAMEAVGAYRKALQIGGFTAATNLYIQERMTQLQDSQVGGR
ncbi:MAG: tetratricopeptide repeat protein [Idiomarina sp.]